MAGVCTLTEDEKRYTIRIVKRCKDWVEVTNRVNAKFGKGRDKRIIVRFCRSMNREPLKMRMAKDGSICFKCANCVPNHQVGDKKPRNGDKELRGCEWSLRGPGIDAGSPVKGWEAVKTKTKDCIGSEYTYHVLSCPKFVEENDNE